MALPSQRRGGTPRARKPLMVTTRDRSPHFDEMEFDDGHVHTFRPGDAHTSTNKGHYHRIVLGRVQTSRVDGHTHGVDREIDELEEYGPHGGREPAR